MKIRQFYIASEDTLTKGQKKKKEKYVKGMKKGAKDFKKRYGDDYKSVMYATATKMAKENTNESPIEQDRDNPIAKPYVDTPEWKALHDMDDKIIDAYIKHKEKSVEEDQIPSNMPGGIGDYAREIATGKLVRIVDYTDDDEGIYTISYGDGKGETDVVAKDLKFKDPTSYWSDEETTEGANLNPYFLTKKEFDGKMRDVWDFPDGYGDEDDSPYLSNFSMRDVLNSLGLDPNFEDAGPIEINKFINITTQWLKKNINKPSAEVPTTVDKSGGGATMIGGGKPEGYENKVIMGFNQFARNIKQKYPKVTHIGIA